MKNDAGYDCAQDFAIWSLSFKSIRSPSDSVNSKTESHSSVSSYQEWRSPFFPRRFEFVHLQQKSRYRRDSIITEVIEHLLTIPLHKPRVKTLGTLLSCTSWSYNGYKNNIFIRLYNSTNSVRIYSAILQNSVSLTTKNQVYLNVIRRQTFISKTKNTLIYRISCVKNAIKK